MKKLFVILGCLTLASTVALNAQRPEPIEKDLTFTVVKELPITSVKNQASSGTCWCYSTLSLLESEILRMGGDSLDLAEMFVVSKAYADKAEKYIRLDGKLNFAQGSSSEDVFHVWEDYGIVPQEVMEGLNYGETVNRHSELCDGMKGYLDAVVRNPNKKLSTAWRRALQGILDAYLGPCPEEFTFKGKKYTPKSFAASLGIKPEDYVSITSFTHHPFYTQFAIEVEDNWRWDLSYNIPIDEMMEIMYNAIDKGYTVAWGTDVSEAGFTRNGLAINPDLKAVEEAGSDQQRWVGIDPAEKMKQLSKMRDDAPEMTVTQEMRQEGYDNKTTTDDHGMHIYGIAKDQNGNKYFMVKNSWGETGKYKGIWYASDSFVRYKTLNIMVHKNAIPKEIKKKMGIK
ncbi:MAG: aminopeptidase [Bacteroidaceae bacterium]|nr:aminopeptidase [Bacteroidaceae bacterium]